MFKLSICHLAVLSIVTLAGCVGMHPELASFGDVSPQSVVCIRGPSELMDGPLVAKPGDILTLTFQICNCQPRDVLLRTGRSPLVETARVVKHEPNVSDRQAQLTPVLSQAQSGYARETFVRLRGSSESQPANEAVRSSAIHQVQHTVTIPEDGDVTELDVTVAFNVGVYVPGDPDLLEGRYTKTINVAIRPVRVSRSPR
jgi:hypothetical protein